MNSDYLKSQKNFWNTDERTARLGRVDTVSRSEEEYERLADEDIQRVVEAIPLKPGATVLEIGCGVGRLLGRFRALHPSVKLIGVDISENMISYARAAHPDLALQVNSGADLPMIESGSVDYAYANDVFIHIADGAVVRSYLAEVRRVLKPSGIFRFNVRPMKLSRMFSNSPGGLLAKASYLLGRSTIGDYQPGRGGFNGHHYRRNDLKRLAKEARLRVISITETPAPDGNRLWCTLTLPPV
jgi:SAM-dependent methyltransferase